MLKGIIKKDCHSFEQRFDDWQEIIRTSHRTPLGAGAIEDIYVQAVIDCVNRYGPYIVIVPDITMPHPTEEAKGCHGTTIPLIKVEEPTGFDKQNPNKKARPFFSLAAVDHEQHPHNIQKFVDTLTNEELVDTLLETHTVEEL